MSVPRFTAKPDPSPDHEGDWVIFDTQENRITEHGYDSKEQAEANILANFPQGIQNETVTS